MVDNPSDFPGFNQDPHKPLELPDSGSFSGTDIEAIVYLPVDFRVLDIEVDKLRVELSTILERGRNIETDRIKWTGGFIPINSDPAEQQKQIRNIKLFRQQRIKDAQESIVRQIKELQALKASGQTNAGKVLAELSTISYSIHRETFPVRSLGGVYAKDYTRGPRTIAGSLVFTVFNQHVLMDMLRSTRAITATGVNGEMPDIYKDVSPVLSDQIPPFDVIIKYNSEFGDSAALVIYGVQIVNEGQVTSVNDMFTENQMEYVARDIDIMRDLSSGRGVIRNLGVGSIRSKTPEDLKEEDDAYKRLLRRRNPFM